MASPNEGLSLLDIGPASEKVPIGDKHLIVYGVSAKGIFELFKRFPEMQQWFKGGKIDMKQFIAEAPDALAAVIAAGCGDPGNPAAEQTAALLPAETQLDILEAIGRLTFTKGFGPFAERIVALAGQAKSVNYGRGQDTRLHQVSKPSPPPVTATPPSGN